MGNSYGFFEVSGVVAATTALDIMCKASDVSFVSWERKFGGRLVTIIIEGSISAVKSAIENATENGIKPPVSYGVIANPHPEIIKIIDYTKQKFTK